MPTAAEIARAAELLRAGRLVVFPTETVYGLGANALDAVAVAKIYAVKARPATSPLIVHVASIEMAKSLAAEWPETADLLTQKFWPGPLTVVVKKQPAIPDIVTAGLNTVALRMPAHPVALALIRSAEIPLAAPSANRFTEISPTTAEHVRRSLGTDVDLILDGGPCNIGIESTVISLAGAPPVLLRPGGISRAQLEAVIGPIASAQTDQRDDDQQDDDQRGNGETGVPARPAITSLMERRASPPVPLQPSVISEAIAHPSPGMHARHYSPHTPLFLIHPGKIRDKKIRDKKIRDKKIRDSSLPQKGKGIYLRLGAPFKPAFGLSGDSLTEDGLSKEDSREGVHRLRVFPPDSASDASITVIQMPQSAAAYAAALYDKLHQADQAGVDWIAVDLPPNTPEWEAVNDRLRRAAFHENK